MLLIQIAYALACVGLAYINYRVIEAGRRVYHGINGAIHLATAILATLHSGLIAGICILLVARLSFDMALNKFRGLPVNYVPLRPTSVVDKIEKRVFEGDGYLPKLIYLVALFILNVI